MSLPDSRFGPLISTSDLHAISQRPDVRLFDCRFSLSDSRYGERAFAEGHIPGSVYVHLDHDLSGPIVSGATGRHPMPSPEVFSGRLETWGVSNDSTVVAYDDRGGAIAARLWFMLKWMGHENVAVLDGGWQQWLEDELPIDFVARPRGYGKYQPFLRPEMIVDVEELERLTANPDVRIMDARAPERYRGEVEPIDPVAGHIPGAISVPFADNISEGGVFKSRDEIRSRFLQLLDTNSPDAAISYCGSGVTGALNVLAMQYAGLDGARLYPGSWSEWILDEARPISKGQQYS